VCPVCAAHPGGDPNLLTDDFSVHLQMQHRASPSVPRDLISFLISFLYHSSYFLIKVKKKKKHNNYDKCFITF